MFWYSVRTLLLYSGGSLLLYLGIAQFITPSKEEKIRKMYNIPKDKTDLTESKKELLMLQMKHVAGLDTENKKDNDNNS